MAPERYRETIMSTDDLIASLSKDLAPAQRRMGFNRLALGLGAGVLVAAVIMPIWLGVRPDLAAAAGSAPFWIKFAYTLAVGASMFWLLERLGRPGARTAAQTLTTLAPPSALLVLAGSQLMLSEASQRHHLMMGASSDVCPWRIVALALPILAGALWALRGLAPTRLTLTGAVAGLCAGGAGAFVYAFHCDESAMPFVALWYSCGILVSGAIGAVLGRRLLRW
jgi:hypothetical protein